MGDKNSDAGNRNRQSGRRGSSRSENRRRLAITNRGGIDHLQVGLRLGRYVVFDIETTGGNPERNGITEIMAIRVVDGQEVDRFYSMVNPKRSIPPIVRRMTGITNQMVRDQPEIHSVMPDFVKFVGDDVLVSHNTIGDMKFLRHFSQCTVGYKMSNYYLCTHLLTEKLLAEMPDKSLKGLAQHLNLATKGKLHRAESDAYLTWELFKILLQRLGQESVRTIADAIRFQGDQESGQRLGWGVPHESWNQLPSSPGLIYLSDRCQNLSLAVAVADLNRDVSELTKTGSLPKSMVKVVLQAQDLRFEVVTCPFQMQLKEAQAIADHQLAIDPADWHQRVAQFVYLHQEDQQIYLGFGPLKVGTIMAFGPIRNGRAIAEFFEDMAEVLGLKAKRKGIHLSPSQATMVRSLLLGFTTVVEPKLWKKILSLFSPTSHAEAQNHSIFQSLQTLAMPSEIRPLKLTTGLLGIKSEDSWRLYKIVAGIPEFLKEVKESDYPFCKESIQQLGTAYVRKLERNQKLVFRKPFDAWQAHVANRVFWWLSQRRRKDSLFVALEDLC